MAERFPPPGDQNVQHFGQGIPPPVHEAWPNVYVYPNLVPFDNTAGLHYPPFPIYQYSADNMPAHMTEPVPYNPHFGYVGPIPVTSPLYNFFQNPAYPQVNQIGHGQVTVGNVPVPVQEMRNLDIQNQQDDLNQQRQGPALNPNAGEFRPGPALNPNAGEFRPGAALNPNAGEFRPGVQYIPDPEYDRRRAAEVEMEREAAEEAQRLVVEEAQRLEAIELQGLAAEDEEHSRAVRLGVASRSIGGGNVKRGVFSGRANSVPENLLTQDRQLVAAQDHVQRGEEGDNQNCQRKRRKSLPLVENFTPRFRLEFSLIRRRMMRERFYMLVDMNRYIEQLKGSSPVAVRYHLPSFQNFEWVAWNDFGYEFFVRALECNAFRSMLYDPVPHIVRLHVQQNLQLQLDRFALEPDKVPVNSHFRLYQYMQGCQTAMNARAQLITEAYCNVMDNFLYPPGDEELYEHLKNAVEDDLSPDARETKRWFEDASEKIGFRDVIRHHLTFNERVGPCFALLRHLDYVVIYMSNRTCGVQGFKREPDPLHEHHNVTSTHAKSHYPTSTFLFDMLDCRTEEELIAMISGLPDRELDKFLLLPFVPTLHSVDLMAKLQRKIADAYEDPHSCLNYMFFTQYNRAYQILKRFGFRREVVPLADRRVVTRTDKHLKILINATPSPATVRRFAQSVYGVIMNMNIHGQANAVYMNKDQIRARPVRFRGPSPPPPSPPRNQNQPRPVVRR